MHYEIALTFQLAAEDTQEDQLLARLAKAGCTDALVGLGRPGYVSLEFTRAGTSSEEARRSALAAAKKALPGARLVLPPS